VGGLSRQDQTTQLDDRKCAKSHVR
jgi:hypothetical protein